jgi:hypothetical protein
VRIGAGRLTTNAEIVRACAVKSEGCQNRRRKVNTVIIGCEADFRRRKKLSREEAEGIVRGLRDYMNLSYDSEAAIAAWEDRKACLSAYRPWASAINYLKPESPKPPN